MNTVTEENKRIKEAFRYLEQNNGSLTENGAYFVQSLKKFFARNKILTEKQQKALYEIRDSINTTVRIEY